MCVSYTYFSAVIDNIVASLQCEQDLGERVERERSQYLWDLQRIEDRS